MTDETVTITLIGGPTALIEVNGLRLLTDPTFDAPGSYPAGPVTLTKTVGPAIAAATLGQIDAVLLSHDQHADNLDHAGRALLPNARRVLTTHVGAKRLGGNAQGLAPWQTIDLATPDGRSLRVTATPARHGPALIQPIVGDVIGFILTSGDQTDHAIYLTGDTVWFDGVAAVSQRFSATVVMPFVGAAQTRGPFLLTMNTNDAIETANAFPNATIVPLHYQGWKHFTQNQDDITQAFAVLGLADRLRVLEAGVATTLHW
jgi:L-ascorbate metabolism protein UlaG (beta-lactamase superfamily)